MCGITGAVWTSSDQSISSPVLTAMMDALHHRGPDDDGQYWNEHDEQEGAGERPGVALGFRRLSIIDLECARQPLSNEDGTVRLVFNGEIYNFAELRQRLEGAGHQFRTNGDGEVIVHLYEDLGVDCFSHLNGMFALALWDGRRNRLVLARDRLGQKPLVYRSQPDRLLFASELKSLLQVPGLRRTIDPTALDHYLTFKYVPHPRSILQGFRKLPPGHYGIYEQGAIRINRYWEPDLGHSANLDRKQAGETLGKLLRSSVALRMQSDVPLGAFLSGGVDSSLIVALMQQESSQKIKTFSIGFPVHEYDESVYARQVAQHLGTDHHEFQVEPDGVAILPKMVWHFDEPFADSSAIPTWYVSELTRKFVTVSLTGDGGDELFVGYPRYKAVDLGSRLDRLAPLRRLFGAPFWQRIPTSSRQKSKLRQMKRFCEALSMSPGRRYLDWISTFNSARRVDLYEDQFLSRLPNEDPYEFLENEFSALNERDPISRTALCDLQTYLPCDLMTKVDIASMAHSLECRQPFLDFRLVEFAARCPIDWHYRRGRGKLMLREQFGPLLPDTIWDRPKMGFGVPLDHWFRHELREMTHDVLLSERAQRRGFFRPDYIRCLIAEHEQRRFDHSHRLWSLLFFEMWLRQWYDTPI